MVLPIFSILQDPCRSLFFGGSRALGSVREYAFFAGEPDPPFEFCTLEGKGSLTNLNTTQTQHSVPSETGWLQAHHKQFEQQPFTNTYTANKKYRNELRNTPKHSASISIANTRLPRFVGRRPWSAHALAPAIRFPAR